MRRFIAHAAFLAAGIAFADPLLAHEGAHAVSDSPRERAARIFFSDRRLVTQDGDEVRFFSDVLKDKVVLISFVFTQCKDTCPLQTRRVADVQALMPGFAGNSVRFVSISVDPVNDRPEVLREYANRFHAGPGWTFLTGDKKDIDDVVRRLGHAAPTREAHTSLFVLGNARTGRWLKLDPDTAPVDIAERLRELAADHPQS